MITLIMHSPELPVNTKTARQRAEQEVYDVVGVNFEFEAQSQNRRLVTGNTFDLENTEFIEDGVSLEIDSSGQGLLGVHILDMTEFPKLGHYETYLRGWNSDEVLPNSQSRSLSMLREYPPTPTISFLFSFGLQTNGEIENYSYEGALRTLFQPIENFDHSADKEDLKRHIGKTKSGVFVYDAMKLIGEHLENERLGDRSFRSNKNITDKFVKEVNIELGVTVASALRSEGADAVLYRQELNRRPSKMAQAWFEAKGLDLTGANYAPLSSPYREPSDLVNLRTFVDVCIDGKVSPYTEEELASTRSRKHIEASRI